MVLIVNNSNIYLRKLLFIIMKNFVKIYNDVIPYGFRGFNFN